MPAGSEDSAGSTHDGCDGGRSAVRGTATASAARATRPRRPRGGTRAAAERGPDAPVVDLDRDQRDQDHAGHRDGPPGPDRTGRRRSGGARAQGIGPVAAADHQGRRSWRAAVRATTHAGSVKSGEPHSEKYWARSRRQRRRRTAPGRPVSWRRRPPRSTSGTSAALRSAGPGGRARSRRAHDGDHADHDPDRPHPVQHRPEPRGRHQPPADASVVAGAQPGRCSDHGQQEAEHLRAHREADRAPRPRWRISTRRRPGARPSGGPRRTARREPQQQQAESHATPASPNQSPDFAITISGSHCVGSQCAVAKVLTEPGCRSDQRSQELLTEAQVEVGVGVVEGNGAQPDEDDEQGGEHQGRQHPLEESRDVERLSRRPLAGRRGRSRSGSLVRSDRARGSSGVTDPGSLGRRRVDDGDSGCGAGPWPSRHHDGVR